MLLSLQRLDVLHAFTSGSWKTNRFGRIVCMFSCYAGFWSSWNVKKIHPWLKRAGGKQCVRARQSWEDEGESLTREGFKDATRATTACGESFEERLTELLLCCCCNSLWVFLFFIFGEGEFITWGVYLFIYFLYAWCVASWWVVNLSWTVRFFVSSWIKVVRIIFSASGFDNV